MTVVKIDITDATDPLAAYVRKADAGPLIITDQERPIAALVLLGITDLETVALSTDPDFLKLIQGSRARHAGEGGMTSAEIRNRLKRGASV